MLVIRNICDPKSLSSLHHPIEKPSRRKSHPSFCLSETFESEQFEIENLKISPKHDQNLHLLDTIIEGLRFFSFTVIAKTQCSPTKAVSVKAQGACSLWESHHGVLMTTHLTPCSLTPHDETPKRYSSETGQSRAFSGIDHTAAPRREKFRAPNGLPRSFPDIEPNGHPSNIQCRAMFHQ